MNSTPFDVQLTFDEMEQIAAWHTKQAKRRDLNDLVDVPYHRGRAKHLIEMIDAVSKARYGRTIVRR